MRKCLDKIGEWVVMLTYIVFCSLLWLTIEIEYCVRGAFRWFRKFIKTRIWK